MIELNRGAITLKSFMAIWVETFEMCGEHMKYNAAEIITKVIHATDAIIIINIATVTVWHTVGSCHLSYSQVFKYN